MKVLQVTSSLTGGAGFSANLLHQGLNSEGHESVLISRQTNANSFQTKKQSFSRINTGVNATITRKDYGFTSPTSISVINPEYLLSLKPDIIHIHNWYNILSWQSIDLLISSGKVVLTMHDSRLLSGGCHVLLGCRNYLESCTACPAVYLGKSRIKKSKQEIDKTFKSTNSFRVITPSKWLAREFKSIYKFAEVRTIENLVHPLFEQAFKPPVARKNRNLVFVASNLDAPFKGLQLLVESLNRLVLNGTKIRLTVVGNGPAKILQDAKFQVLRHPEVSPESLIRILQDNDLLVVPSLSDNYPGVIKEAQLSGIPVLGTTVGGIGEMIDDGKTGFLCLPNVESLTEKLRVVSIADLSDIAIAARKFAAEGKSNREIIAKHLEFYEKI